MSDELDRQRRRIYHELADLVNMIAEIDRSTEVVLRIAADQRYANQRVSVEVTVGEARTTATYESSFRQTSAEHVAGVLRVLASDDGVPS